METKRNFKKIETKDGGCATGSCCGSNKATKNANVDITSLFVAVTSTCNFSCSYCCRYEVENKINVADVKKAIDSIPTLERVKLSGGEVTVNLKECLEIIQYCTDRDIETQINTNGTLLNAEKIKALETAGLDYLHVSFDFIDREDHARYYNVSPRMHDKIVENIKLALQTKIDVIAESIICKETVRTVNDIHTFLNSMGIRIHEIQNGIPQEKQECWNEITNPKETIRIIKDIIKNKKPGTDLFFSCTGFDIEREGRTDDFDYAGVEGVNFPSCIAAKHQLHLASNGDVLLCELGCPEVIGNVLEGKTIIDIINDSTEKRSDFSDEHKCRRAVFFNELFEKIDAQLT